MSDKHLEETFHTLPLEKDPHGKNPHELGAKLDAGKTPVFQGMIKYFPRAMMAVAEVSAFGANKYAWNGWETVTDGHKRYTDAAARHQLYTVMGEDLDPDSKLLHEAHEVWNKLAALELRLRS